MIRTDRLRKRALAAKLPGNLVNDARFHASHNMTLRHKVNANSPLDGGMASCHSLKMKTFGERLAESRTDKIPKWSQTKLGEELGVDQSTISKWETDDRTPQGVLDNIFRYAEVLGVNPMWLLHGTEPKKGNAQMSRNIHYFRMLETLPEKDREIIYRMIEMGFELHGGEPTPDPQLQGRTS